MMGMRDQLNMNVPLPMMAPPPSDLLTAALAACERRTAMAERDITMRCSASSELPTLAEQLSDLHSEAIGARPLPGRGLETFPTEPAQAQLNGDGIDTIGCTQNPLCMPGAPCSSMNAFATTNLMVLLDPLLNAFAEGAAFWANLVNDAGDVDAVDEAVLFEGLGNIYWQHAQGGGFATVSREDVDAALENDDFANEVFFGAAVFLFFHEVGHANLGHGLINHTAQIGAHVLLNSEGTMLTADQMQQINTEVRNLKVFTETQSDIYAATLLRELQFSSDGPVILFTGAMAAMHIASGQCNAAMTQEQLFDCAFARDPNATHPPLDIRATVLRRIIDDGEDLSAELELIEPPAQ